MATLDAKNLTLADHAKRLDPTGKVSKIVEMLGQANPMIDDMTFVEGNLTAGHRTTIRTGLPTVYWRKINQGTPSSKSTTAQVDEGCAMLEARSQVDVKLAALAGDLAAFRLSEASPFVEAMSQEASQTLIYGNTALAMEEFTGLSTRYSSLSATNGRNILSGSGSGSDNSSIWLIGWGDNTVHGIFPKGTKAGIQHKDLGEQDAFDASNNRFRAFMDLWNWDMGVVVKDWRYAVRIANLDVSNLGAKSSAADLIELMIKAIHRFPMLNGIKPVFYTSRSVMQALDIQKRDDVISGGGLVYDNVDGKPVNSFRGIPVKICDSILETETAVS